MLRSRLEPTLSNRVRESLLLNPCLPRRMLYISPVPRGQPKTDPDVVPKMLVLSLDPELRAALQRYHDATGRGQRTVPATAREVLNHALSMDPPTAVVRAAALEAGISAKRFALSRLHGFLGEMQQELAQHAVEYAQGRFEPERELTPELTQEESE